MNKILVLPDIHGRTFWKNAVDKHEEECDKIIFLGDYVDPYETEGITIAKTLENYKEIIEFKENNLDKVVLLLGNHDLHYVMDGFNECSRYRMSLVEPINSIFQPHKELFKLAHEEVINGKRFIFSHAGIMRSWYERHKDEIGDFEIENFNKILTMPNGGSMLNDISNYRTWFGGEKSGSMVWSDIRERVNDEDENIEGIYQVFGHTLMEKEYITDKWACIDCKQAFVIDDNGNVKKTENSDIT